MNTATIRIVCTSCGSKLDIRSELAGSKRRCPKCKTEFVVPSAEDEDGGVSLAAESETVAETTSKTPAPLSDSDVPSTQASKAGPATPPAANDEDDDDEDYMPSFVTAAVKDDAKTPLPPTSSSSTADTKDEDDDGILSIPNLPPPPKPKFKTFETDEFADEDGDSATQKPAGRTSPTPSSARDKGGRRNQLSDEFDIDEPSPPPKSRGSTRSANLSDSSIPTPSPTRDRAAAARELRQALKDSSLREVPEQQTRGGFNIDFAGLGSELGLKGLAIILGIVLLCPILYFTVNSMVAGKGLKLPPLGYVTGTVTYNGAPAVNAIVRFMPVPKPGDDSNSTNYNKIRTSTGKTNEKGEYTLMYVEDVKGVAIGNCRVWIELDPPLVAPGEFSPAGSTMREIKSGSQTYDFAMTASPAQK